MLGGQDGRDKENLTSNLFILQIIKLLSGSHALSNTHLAKRKEPSLGTDRRAFRQAGEQRQVVTSQGGDRM